MMNEYDLMRHIVAEDEDHCSQTYDLALQIIACVEDHDRVGEDDAAAFRTELLTVIAKMWNVEIRKED